MPHELLLAVCLAAALGGCSLQSRYGLREPRPVRAALYIERLYLDEGAHQHRAVYTDGIRKLLACAFDQVVPVAELDRVAAVRPDLVVVARVDQGYSTATFFIDVEAELEVRGLDGKRVYAVRHRESSWNWYNNPGDHEDALEEAMGPAVRALQGSEKVVAYLAAARPELAAVYRGEGDTAPQGEPPAGPAPAPAAAPAPPAPAPARAAEGAPIVAVFDLERKGVELRRAALDRLTDLLTSRLAASGAFRLVPRQQITERLAAQKRESYRPCYDESCQVEIGRELAAGKSLAARVLKVGSGCVLTLNLYDLRTATLERASSVEGGCDEGAVADMIGRASRELAAGAAPRKAAGPKPASRPAPRAGALRRKAKKGGVHLELLGAPEGSRLLVFSANATRMKPGFVPWRVRFPVASCRGPGCELDLQSGSYAVVAAHPGGRIEHSWIDLQHNRACKLDLGQKGERERGDGKTGTIRVVGTPAASLAVLLGEQQVRRSGSADSIPIDACIGLPCRLEPLERGSYWIVVTADRHRSASLPVQISSKRDLELRVDLEPI
ncbi:MAG: hypothetical protein JXR96_29825 [Deltaproteobacteria bacterium]|nr:hypothetical protein [Deltaproteobacteria bacterium]